MIIFLTVKFGHPLVNDALLRVGILNCGVVVSHKVALKTRKIC
jgi:hypothetical protein